MANKKPEIEYKEVDGVLYDKNDRAVFTEEMRKTHTILLPQMAPYHFDLLVAALKYSGYNVDLIKTTNQNLINEGLKYVHNDTCVPALFVIGQLIDAIKNGEYDDKKIALIITQTGGGCRASNYIHLLRRALKKAGYPHIPVISFNVHNLDPQPGFNLNLKMAFTLLNSILIGDLFMQLIHETRPYEINKGETLKAYDEMIKEYIKKLEGNKMNKFKHNKAFIKDVVERFKAIPVEMKDLPKVGIVGEIYVKFSPLGNNNLEEFLYSEGCEIVVPPILDFLLYSLDHVEIDKGLAGGRRLASIGAKWFMRLMERRRGYTRKLLKGTRFHLPGTFEQLKEVSAPFVSTGTRMGEGWLLTAEMVELIHMGVPNIICTQPFGCLPNHITGKGMFKPIKKAFPEANIVPIDYDTSASEVNQINRLKLMLANAKGM